MEPIKRSYGCAHVLDVVGGVRWEGLFVGILIWSGFIAFFVASLVVGIRLLLLWRMTRELPELMIGLGVLGIGPVGFGSQIVGQAIFKSARNSDPMAEIPTIATALFIVGTLTAVGGVMCKLVFNWKVYHPDASWARGLVMAAIATLCGLFVARLVIDQFEPMPIPTALANLQTTLQVSVLGWGAAEALVYWRQMRRRTQLGLADPAVTNRFLLWGIGAAAAAQGTAIATIAAIALQQPSLQIPWVVMTSAAHGMLAAIAMSLAFMPPAFYLCWVRRGMAQASV